MHEWMNAFIVIVRDGLLMKGYRSILVVFLLEGALDMEADVVGLVLIHDGQLGVEGTEVQAGHLLVQDLGQFVDGIDVFVGGLVVPEFKLGQGLVAEGVAHHEGGVAGSTA